MEEIEDCWHNCVVFMLWTQTLLFTSCALACINSSIESQCSEGPLAVVHSATKTTLLCWHKVLHISKERPSNLCSQPQGSGWREEKMSQQTVGKGSPEWRGLTFRGVMWQPAEETDAARLVLPLDLSQYPRGYIFHSLLSIPRAMLCLQVLVFYTGFLAKAISLALSLS